MFELSDNVCFVAPEAPKKLSVPLVPQILLVPSPVYSAYHGTELEPRLYGYVLELACGTSARLEFKST